MPTVPGVPGLFHGSPEWDAFQTFRAEIAPSVRMYTEMARSANPGIRADGLAGLASLRQSTAVMLSTFIQIYEARVGAAAVATYGSLRAAISVVGRFFSGINSLAPMFYFEPAWEQLKEEMGWGTAKGQSAALQVEPVTMIDIEGSHLTISPQELEAFGNASLEFAGPGLTGNLSGPTGTVVGINENNQNVVIMAEGMSGRLGVEGRLDPETGMRNDFGPRNFDDSGNPGPGATPGAGGGPGSGASPGGQGTDAP